MTKNSCPPQSQANKVNGHSKNISLHFDTPIGRKIPRDDYEYFWDDETERTWFIDTETGECDEAKTAAVVPGSRILTPAEQRRFKKRMFRRSTEGKEGAYFFIAKQERFAGISPESVMRLVYLCSYADYSGKLMRTERTPMKHDDLPDILKVSKSTARRFLREVCPAYIKDEEDGLSISEKRFVRRGKLPKGSPIGYMRIYQKGIRELYDAVQSYKRRLSLTGRIFKLIPFINDKYGLICMPESIDEAERDRIELPSMEEFCESIEFDTAHMNELLSTYRAIRLGEDGEPFCSIRYSSLKSRDAEIRINPRVLDAGRVFKDE